MNGVSGSPGFGTSPGLRGQKGMFYTVLFTDPHLCLGLDTVVVFTLLLKDRGQLQFIILALMV